MRQKLRLTQAFSPVVGLESLFVPARLRVQWEGVIIIISVALRSLTIILAMWLAGGESVTLIPLSENTTHTLVSEYNIQTNDPPKRFKNSDSLLTSHELYN